jgi:hypothetical protein
VTNQTIVLKVGVFADGRSRPNFGGETRMAEIVFFRLGVMAAFSLLVVFALARL